MKCKSLLLFCLFTTTCAVAQQNIIDSLKHKLTTVKTDTNRVNLLSELANQYVGTKPDSSVLLSQQGLELARKLDYAKGKIRCLIAMGRGFRYLGNYVKAIEIYKQALKISEENKDQEGIMMALNGYAFIYYLQGDYRKELSLYLQNVTQARKHNDTSNLIGALANAGHTYLNLEQYDSAIGYLQEAYQLIKKKRLKTGTAGFVMGRLGILHGIKGDKDLALFYFQQSISIFKELNDKHRLSEFYGAIAGLYQMNKQIDSAFYYAKKSFSIGQETPFPVSAIYRPGLILTDLYEGVGNYKEALRYHRIYAAARDSISNREMMNQLSNIVFNEQLQQQEIEAARQQYKNQMKMYALLTALLVFLLLAVILYRNNLRKRKANALLKRQKEDLQAALKELRSTQAQLLQREKMASLGELTAGIAHEIQNPLNFVKNFSEVSVEQLEELESAAIERRTEEVVAIASNIRNNLQKVVHHEQRADAIVKSMLQHSRTTTGEKQSTDINALADEYLRLAYHGMRAKDKSFNAIVETHFDPSIERINAVPQDIGRVLLNLFNNAFYSLHQKKQQLNGTFEPVVSVSTKKENGKVQITVRDNGVGIPQKILDKIYQPFFTTKPTGEGTGLGLSLSYDIITKGHGGELEVNTLEGEYAEFIIQLPTS